MKYPFKVYQTQVDNHVFWIAECPSLKGCVGQGDTIDKAISELEENEAVWLDTASECGIEIPSVPIETVNEYSGKFTVSVSPSVHMTAASYARKENISLNQYINDAIVAQNTRYETVNYVATPIMETIETFKMLLSNSSCTINSKMFKVFVNDSFPHYNSIGVTTASKNASNMHSVGAQ